jgi:pyrroline-5-carboxylate reductase
MRIAFIGGGNMGEAMISAVVGKKLASPLDVTVSDIDVNKLSQLKTKYGINVTDNNRRAVANSDIIVMAIKPQNLDAVMTGLKGQLKPSQLVLSIIAGKRIGTLSAGLDHKCIVRTMPNTPAQIGRGISVWTATAQVSSAQKTSAAAILGSMGAEVLVDDEKYLDMATAVSGSGPAYVFLFVEAMTAAAVRIGVPQEMAEKLVIHTLQGAGELITRSGKSPAELRRMVTSPGGTTAEAIAWFEKGNFSELVAGAVNAAYEKAKKLGS